LEQLLKMLDVNPAWRLEAEEVAAAVCRSVVADRRLAPTTGPCRATERAVGGMSVTPGSGRSVPSEEWKFAVSSEQR
jgi:hypothetical protein